MRTLLRTDDDVLVTLPNKVWGGLGCAYMCALCKHELRDMLWRAEGTSCVFAGLSR